MGQVSQHMRMGAAMQIDLGTHRPMQAAEQNHILRLDMRVKFTRPARPCGADGQPDQFRPQLADAAHMALITQQQPVRVAIHASELISLPDKP